jgi:hypothetical protein
MSGGSQSNPAPQQVTTTTSNLPEYARPYFENLMSAGQAFTLGNLNAPTYGQERIAGFTPGQQQVQQDILGMQTPGQFGAATGLTSAAGLGSLQAAQYSPGQFGAQQIGQPNLQQFSMNAPGMVRPGEFGSPQMGTAQTGYNPNLQYFQMEGPQAFGSTQAQQYMSPFIEQALEPQMRSAVTDAQRAQLAQNLGAARQGTYGGSRQLLATLDRESNLAQQLGDIRARGMQSAFENAQQQFERDRTAQMTTGQANLQSALGVQQLGTQTGLQSALANLDAASQANVQNLAAQLQTQGLNAEQALRAALANQQSELTVGQQNLQSALQTQQLGTQAGLEALRANQQADLERQRMAEQSRQFGATQTLAGLAQAGQMGQTLSNIGTGQAQADQARLGLQAQTAAQEQALNQQRLDQHYQDFLRERDYPLEMLQQYSSLLRGVPVQPNTTQTTYAQQPGIAQQIMGTGLGALGMARTLGL